MKVNPNSSYYMLPERRGKLDITVVSFSLLSIYGHFYKVLEDRALIRMIYTCNLYRELHFLSVPFIEGNIHARR